MTSFPSSVTRPTIVLILGSLMVVSLSQSSLAERRRFGKKAKPAQTTQTRPTSTAPTKPNASRFGSRTPTRPSPRPVPGVTPTPTPIPTPIPAPVPTPTPTPVPTPPPIPNATAVVPSAGGVCTSTDVQAAVDRAPRGGTVVFNCPQPIRFNGPVYIEKSLTLDGQGVAVLDGGGVSRLLVITRRDHLPWGTIDGRDDYTNAQGQRVMPRIVLNLQNITLQNAVGTPILGFNDGAAILQGVWADLNATNVQFLNNRTTGDGGAIFKGGTGFPAPAPSLTMPGLAGSITLQNCTFTNNQASGRGGAIGVGNGQSERGLVITGGSFNQNRSLTLGEAGGGAIGATGINISINGTTFTGNQSTLGGAIATIQSAFQLQNVTFIGNASAANGTFLRADRGNQPETGTRAGGAVYIDGLGTLVSPSLYPISTFNNVRFLNNQGFNAGGAMLVNRYASDRLVMTGGEFTGSVLTMPANPGIVGAHVTVYGTSAFPVTFNQVAFNQYTTNSSLSPAQNYRLVLDAYDRSFVSLINTFVPGW